MLPSLSLSQTTVLLGRQVPCSQSSSSPSSRFKTGVHRGPFFNSPLQAIHRGQPGRDTFSPCTVQRPARRRLSPGPASRNASSVPWGHLVMRSSSLGVHLVSRPPVQYFLIYSFVCYS